MLKQTESNRAKSLLILLALFLLSKATAAQIDNCCFVDRQCTTNYDWVSGYYAFQNNHCPSPSRQQQQSTPSQPKASASEVINNCCFSGWQCSTDDDWVSGYFAFQQNHCFSRSHWEEQMRKRQSAETAARNSDQDQQEGQGRDRNKNRRPQPEQQPEKPLEWISSTLFERNGPDEQTHTASDGSPVYTSANDPGYMCYLNPGSDWCDGL